MFIVIALRSFASEKKKKNRFSLSYSFSSHHFPQCTGLGLLYGPNWNYHLKITRYVEAFRRDHARNHDQIGIFAKPLRSKFISYVKCHQVIYPKLIIHIITNEGISTARLGSFITHIIIIRIPTFP